MVPVTAETNHCENYLKILLLRYPEKFTYYFEVHEEVENAVSFPFLIQVFVENAAKHALTLEKVPLISVTVYPEAVSYTHLDVYKRPVGRVILQSQISYRVVSQNPAIIQPSQVTQHAT